MNADKLTDCPRCKSDACYSQEINDKITNYQCYGCGFISNTLMIPGSEFMQEKEKYPNPKQPGKYYKFRMDMKTMKVFKERDFMDALSYIGVLPE